MVANTDMNTQSLTNTYAMALANQSPIQGINSSNTNDYQASFANTLLAALGTSDSQGIPATETPLAASPLPLNTGGTAISQTTAEWLIGQILTSLPMPGSNDSTTSNNTSTGISSSAAAPGGTDLNSLLQILQNQNPLNAVLTAAPPASTVQTTVAADQNTNPTAINAAISNAAAKYHIPASLIRGIVEQESGMDATAISSAGAIGLMQLMPGTAQALGVSNPLDAAQNIDGGSRYLASLLQKYGGNVPMALAAYNAGPGAVDKYQGVPPYQETQNYVKNVVSLSQRYQTEGF